MKNINEHYSKQWLLIDSVLKKLKRAKMWSTFLDSHNENLEKAIAELEEALKKLEKTIENT